MTESVSPLTVLLADEDQLARDLTVRFLASAGCNCKAVATGAEVLQHASLGQFDIVITEMSMPGVGGLDLLRELKRLNPTQAILVVSNSSSLDQTLSALREGASDVLQKPIDCDSLMRAVDRTMQRTQHESRWIYDFVEAEYTKVTLTSAQLAARKFCFPILERLMRSGKIDRMTKLRLELALQEATTNSLDHGNLELLSEWKEVIDSEGIDQYTRERRKRLNDPTYAQRKITLISEFNVNTLSFKIKDQGRGFIAKERDHHERADPACHGRGLDLIRTAVDQVFYECNGSEITLVKRIG